jgi:ATP-dependent Lon protease
MEEALKHPQGSRLKPSSVLDEDHFGLDKVKERILEYLAVQQPREAP